MPKGQPVKSSKALTGLAKRTRSRKKVRGRGRLKIIPPRHIVKGIWATLSTEELVQVKQKQCTITHDQSFRVPSASAPDKTYDVLCDSEGVWTCNCPDFMYRSASNQARYGFYCKHVADSIDKVLAAKK